MKTNSTTTPAAWRERVWAFLHLTLQRPKVKATWGTFLIFAAGIAAYALTSSWGIFA